MYALTDKYWNWKNCLKIRGPQQCYLVNSLVWHFHKEHFYQVSAKSERLFWAGSRKFIKNIEKIAALPVEQIKVCSPQKSLYAISKQSAKQFRRRRFFKIPPKCTQKKLINNPKIAEQISWAKNDSTRLTRGPWAYSALLSWCNEMKWNVIMVGEPKQWIQCVFRRTTYSFTFPI